jgi:erythromycin esterase-like protein
MTRRLLCLFGAVLIWPAAAQETSAVRDWIAGHAIRLTTPEAGHGFDDMQPLKQVVGDARIVALGEATHGTREFFQLKHRMVEFLATQMGFNIFAIEANMPEAYKLNDYVLHGTGDPAALIKGMYFWTWDTQEVLAMVKWMREFNTSGKGKIQFTGFDMQTPNVAAKIVGDFIAAHDAEYAPTLQKATRLALAPSAQQTRFASATGSFPPSAAAGKMVRFSGYIKTRDVSTGYAGLWFRADGASPSLAFKDLGDAAPKGTTDWQKYDLEIAVPAETRNINFGALLSGEGTAWFDKLSVELDGVRYDDDKVFGFMKPANPYQQGPYQLRLDTATLRDGVPTLMIRRQGQPANAVDPKEGVAAWKDVVRHMELAREKYGANPDTDWAIQNARVVLQCMQGRANEVYRDESMAANIRWILDQNPGAKMVVWAHNGHVNFGGRSGMYAPMGEWLRQADDKEMVVFGFAFNQGSFQAVEMGKSLHDFTVGPSPAGSLDAMFASTRIPLFALDLRKLPKEGPVAEWFAQPHKARTIGAVYSEANAENYFIDRPAPPAFHVLLYVDKTTAALQNGPLPPGPPAAEYKDDQYALTMKLTPEVQVQNVTRWGDQETTVFLRTGSGTASLYFKVLREPRPPSADLLKAALDSKVKQRLDEGTDGYHVRPYSCASREIAGRPALSCLADFKLGGADQTEYLTFVMSEKTTALFFARCPPGQMDALRAQVDKVIETVRIP